MYVWEYNNGKVLGKKLCLFYSFSPLPNINIYDPSKLKAFADNNVKVAQMDKFSFSRVENIVGKEENDGYQHFSPSPTMLLEVLFPRVIKSRDCVAKD